MTLRSSTFQIPQSVHENTKQNKITICYSDYGHEL